MSRSVRITFLGNDRWSVPSLEALAASKHEVRAVVTAVPRPAGRGDQLTPTLVADEARALGIPLIEVETVKEGPGHDALVATSPDVLVVVAYGEILPPSILALPAIAPVNLHFSLLPELRGASPVQTALLLDLERTGVTTIVMERGLDTGPVVMQRPEPIGPADDAGSLGARLAALGAELLVETIDLYGSGPVAALPQDDSLATYAPRFEAEDRLLAWSNPARVLINLCRAMSPRPAASTTFRGERLKVFRAAWVSAVGEPGTIVRVDANGFVVATMEGGFAPLELAPAGRARMSALDFVNGFHPEVGERLG